MKTSGPSRLLCIAPWFVPVTNAESFCGAKMVRALRDLGLDVTVIYSTNYPTGRTAALDESGTWNFTRSYAIDVPVSSRKGRLQSLSSFMSYQSQYARWVDAVVQRAVELHKVDRFDLVYSRSWPMIAHVAGFWCAKTLKLPWIANVNDPWDICYFPGAEKHSTSLQQWFAWFWMKRTFTNAQLVTFPSQRLADFHFRLSGMEPPTQIIPHIGSSVNLVSSPTTQSTTPLFSMVHAGNLDPDFNGRSISALLVALASFLAKNREAQSVMRLVLVGPEYKETKDQVEALCLAGNIISVGRVSYEKSLVYISQASVCVLIEAKMDEGIFFPSKLADYIACKKPILSLSPRVGVVSELSQRGGITRVDADDPIAIERAITDFYSDFTKGVLLNRVPDNKLVKQFEAQTVAAQFFDAMCGIVPVHA